MALMPHCCWLAKGQGELNEARTKDLDRYEGLSRIQRSGRQ